MVLLLSATWRRLRSTGISWAEIVTSSNTVHLVQVLPVFIPQHISSSAAAAIPLMDMARAACCTRLVLVSPPSGIAAVTATSDDGSARYGSCMTNWMPEQRLHS